MATRTRVVQAPAAKAASAPALSAAAFDPTATGDPRIEEYLKSKGVPFVYFENVPTEEFDVDRSLRNQVRFEALDEELVDVYTEAMRRGDRFPPNIAYRSSGKLVNVDGNHRMMSSIKADKPVSGVYDITGADPAAITTIAFEINTKHGKATSEAERIQQALYLLEIGTTLDAASAAVNLPKRVVQRALQKFQTESRFRETNIPDSVTGRLSEAVRGKLSGISTDEGFVAAVNLAAASQMPTPDIAKMVTHLNTMRSSTKQVEYVETLRQDWQDAIQAAGGGALGAKNTGRRPIGPRTRVGGALSHLEALPADLNDLASIYTGPERELVIQRAREGAKRLNALARVLST